MKSKNLYDPDTRRVRKQLYATCFSPTVHCKIVIARPRPILRPFDQPRRRAFRDGYPLVISQGFDYAPFQGASEDGGAQSRMDRTPEGGLAISCWEVLMRIHPNVALFLLFFLFAVALPGRGQEPVSPEVDSQRVVRLNPSLKVSPGQTRIDPAEEADIRKLMDLVGAKALAMQAMAATEKALRPLMTRALPPGEYRGKLVELFLEKFDSQADPQGALDLIVPIYARYFSDQEIQELIQFYETPVGKKAVLVLPKIAAESREAGGEWGRKLGRDAMREVLTEHPDLARALVKARSAASPR
jgi:uncharacterized protein